MRMKMMMMGGRVKMASPLLPLLCLLAQGLAQVPSVGSRRLQRVLEEKRRAEVDTIFEINRPLIFNEDPRATFLIEADIMSQQTRNAVADSNLKWPKSPDGMVHIPYEMYTRYEPEQVAAIKEAMDELNNRTCVRFVPRDNEADYLAFYPVMGCYASIGHHQGMQIVSLDQRCLSKGIIQHELLHTLGFWHEQARSDRDAYVSVQWDNIIPGYEHNFDKERTNNMNTPYDYGSLLHYNRFAFTQNRKPTLVPTLETNATLGQRVKLSDEDVFKVNRLYECGAYPRGSYTEVNTDKISTESRSNSSVPNGRIAAGNDNVALTTPPPNSPDSPSPSTNDIGYSALPVNELSSEYITQPTRPPEGTTTQLSLESTTVLESTTTRPNDTDDTEITHSQSLTGLPGFAEDITGTAPAAATTARTESSADTMSPLHTSPSTTVDHDTSSQSPASQTGEPAGVEDDKTTIEPDAKTLPGEIFDSTENATTTETPSASRVPHTRPATTTAPGGQQPLTTTTTTTAAAEGSAQPTTPSERGVASGARKLALRRGPLEGESVFATDEAMCDFEASERCPWAQSVADDFDWTLAVGGTPSWDTGPRADRTLGRCGLRTGHYMYTEASYPREEGHAAVLISAVLRGPKCLAFWYHMNGASMGSLNVHLELLGSTDWPVLWSASGHQGHAWLYAELAVFVPPLQLFKLHLEGVLGSGFQGDAAVDDLLVTSGECAVARQRQHRFACEGDAAPELLPGK